MGGFDLLDPKLVRSLGTNGFTKPTLLQSIWLSKPSKRSQDIFIKSHRRSGKTLTALIWILRETLGFQNHSSRSTVGYVVTATKDRAQKTANLLKGLSMEFNGPTILNLVQGAYTDTSLPVIAVGTPAKILDQLRDRSNNVGLNMLVVDDIDIALELEYGEMLDDILKFFDDSNSTMLISTSQRSQRIDEIRMNTLKDPLVLDLADYQEETLEFISHQAIQFKEDDKYLVLYAVLKLNLIQGRTIIFVNSITKVYQLKLFFDRFFIPCNIIDQEVPIEFQQQSIQDIHRGSPSYLISTDLKGLDITLRVDVVINFDFPNDVETYVHRAKFIESRSTDIPRMLSFTCDEWNAVYKELSGRIRFERFVFETSRIDGFRYRVNDVFASINPKKIKRFRDSAIKTLILDSGRLKDNFSENRRYLETIHQTSQIKPTDSLRHLKNIPEYILNKEESYQQSVDLDRTLKPFRSNK